MSKINVNSKSPNGRENPLSNLTYFSFMLDDKIIASVEGFVQGVKLPVTDPTREIAFSSAGKYARSHGADAGQKYVWWEGKELLYGSTAHHKLIERAIRAKFEQNGEAMSALLATKGMQIVQEAAERESLTPSLPAVIFCDILTRIREEVLQAEETTSWRRTATIGQ